MPKKVLIERLDEAGMPVVFIDFRRNAAEKLVQSLLIWGVCWVKKPTRLSSSISTSLRCGASPI